MSEQADREKAKEELVALAERAKQRRELAAIAKAEAEARKRAAALSPLGGEKRFRASVGSMGLVSVFPALILAGTIAGLLGGAPSSCIADAVDDSASDTWIEVWVAIAAGIFLLFVYADLTLPRRSRASLARLPFSIPGYVGLLQSEERVKRAALRVELPPVSEHPAPHVIAELVRAVDEQTVVSTNGGSVELSRALPAASSNSPLHTWFKPLARKFLLPLHKAYPFETVSVVAVETEPLGKIEPAPSSS